MEGNQVELKGYFSWPVRFSIKTYSIKRLVFRISSAYKSMQTSSSRVKTRRGVSGVKMDLVCEPDVSGNKEDVGPPVFTGTCCESLSYISWQYAEITEITKNMTEAIAGLQEVHGVNSRSARRPDVSGSHSRSILTR